MSPDSKRIDAFFVCIKVPQEETQSSADAVISKSLSRLFSQRWDRVTESSGFGGEIVYQIDTPGRMSEKNLNDFFVKMDIFLETHKEKFLPRFVQKEGIDS